MRSSCQPWRDAALRPLKHVPGTNFNAMELAALRGADASLAVFRERGLLPGHLEAFNSSSCGGLSSRVANGRFVLRSDESKNGILGWEEDLNGAEVQCAR